MTEPDLSVGAQPSAPPPQASAAPDWPGHAPQHHFRALVESSDDVIISKTLQGIITSWNPAAVRLFGYSESEMLGQPVTRLIPPDRLHEEAQILGKIGAGERVEHFETVRLRKGGQEIRISVSISPIRDETGRIVGASKIARDIGDQLRLQATARQYEAIVASSDDGIMSRTIDGRITSWNAAAERMFGYSAAEIVGQPIGCLIPEERRPEEMHIQQLIQQGRKVDHFETVRRRKDGGLVDVSITVSPIRDSGQRIVGASAIARDISDRKLAEYRLRMAANVFTYASEAILITDADGIVLEANEAFTTITGHVRMAVLGRSVASLLDTDSECGAFSELDAVLRAQGHCRGELRGRRKDGGSYAALLTMNRLPSPTGEVHHLVLMTDITAIADHQAALHRLAHFDTLTGLPNRRLLLDRLQQSMHRARRGAVRLAIAYIDLDGFKAVNDRHGHAAGDLLLATLARRMQAALRETDTLARLGGDEFVALLIDTDSTVAVQTVLARLLNACREPVDLGGFCVEVSASVGLADPSLMQHALPEAVLRSADEALYRAKRAGKDCVICASDALQPD